MPIEIPDLEELHERQIDAFKAALPEDDVSRFSDNWKRTRVTSGLGFQLNHHISVVADDVMPDTSGDPFIERHGFVHGVDRKPATPARRADSLRVFGVPASSGLLGEELVHDNGLRYQVNENFVIPAGGFVDVDCIAIDTGIQTILQAGEVLTFVSPPAGVEAEAELQLDLDQDGEDRESLGDYRERILNRIRQPAAGGNSNDYEQFALEEEGVSSAYVYPIRNGLGTVDLAALHAGSGTVRLLTLSERTALQTAIDAKRPVAIGFRVLEVTTAVQNIEITIVPRPEAEHQFDWVDQTPLVVASWTAATRTLEFTASRPSDMFEGDRIVIKPAANNGTGEEFVIESFGVNPDEVILDRAPTPAPVATDTVYSGGPLTTPIRDAILAFMDELGPAVGDYGVGNWESDISPNRVEIAALTVDGMRDGTTIIPAVTAVPDDPPAPANTTIEMFIPGQTIVRKEW
jgi:uncharacterized phage protein gp47/JayE